MTISDLFMLKESQMFKALKDNKIIAINETGEFPCLVYDEVVEDTDHNVDDFIHVDGEFVLKTDDKAIRQQKAQRIAELKAYLTETDYIANKLIEAVDEAETQDLKEKYADTLKKRREARAEINQLEK